MNKREAMRNELSLFKKTADAFCIRCFFMTIRCSQSAHSIVYSQSTVIFFNFQISSTYS